MAARATVTRRAVLGTALVGGAGVAAARILGAGPVDATAAEPTTEPLADSAALVSGVDWISPLGDERSRIAHLLRRTTLGYTAEELETAAADGYERTVDRILETPAAEPPPLAGADEASQEQPLRPDRLQTWWVDWMLRSPTPFAEAMTLFWHGHFTSEYRKVGVASPFMYWQNRTWREFALADLRTMLYQVTVDPAMLVYLDLAQSSGRNPNENYARELMELYAMGSGTFTEDDVQAASKALAGWRAPFTDAMRAALIARAEELGRTLPRAIPPADAVKAGVFVPQRAYRGPAFGFLGVTKTWDTEAVIDRILEQDSVAPFVAGKVLRRFVGPSVDDATIGRAAARFRASGYDVRSLMRDVLRSPEFIADASYRNLVRSPIELMVNAAKALNAPALSRLIVTSSPGFGHVLFDPPSVGGWTDGAGWVSSNGMLGRINFATVAVQQTRSLPSSADAAALYLDSTVGPQTAAILNTETEDRRRWIAVLSSPEAQLK